VAPNPERTGVVLYSQTYVLVQQSALVRADSLLRSVRELDRPGEVDFIRERDTLVVSKLDRLARSTQHLLEIVDRVKRKGAHLQVLDLGMDTGTATGKLLQTMIAAIGQFEREMMLERQREGIAKAKADGKYKGRKPTARARRARLLPCRRRAHDLSARPSGAQPPRPPLHRGAA
jgi:hypothetical protein